MAVSGAFTPGQTQTVTVGTSSVSVSVNPDASMVRVLAVGNTPVFLRFGTGPQTATASDFPIIPNVAEVINKGVGADTLALISPQGGSDTVYITTGG